MKRAIPILAIILLIFSCATPGTGTRTAQAPSLDATSLKARGTGSYKASDFAGALSDYLAAARKAPGDLETTGMIGLCQAQLGDLANGRKNLERFLASPETKSGFMLHEAGRVYGKIFKEYDRAIMILNDAIVAHWASDCRDYLEMGDIYLAMGKQAMAKETYRKAYTIAQQSQDAAGIEAALAGIAGTE